jgi:hypothetical protein
MQPEPGILAASSSESPIWPCSRRGLPYDFAYAKTRWALTPPFHPYPFAETKGRYISVALSFLWRIVQSILLLQDSLLYGVRTFLSIYIEQLPTNTAKFLILNFFFFQNNTIYHLVRFFH